MRRINPVHCKTRISRPISLIFTPAGFRHRNCKGPKREAIDATERYKLSERVEHNTRSFFDTFRRIRKGEIEKGRRSASRSGVRNDGDERKSERGCTRNCGEPLRVQPLCSAWRRIFLFFFTQHCPLFNEPFIETSLSSFRGNHLIVDVNR